MSSNNHRTPRQRPEPDRTGSVLGCALEEFEPLEETFDGAPDLVCFSHLRWNFVYQRPQHLMSRCARERRVFYVEEPILEADGQAPRMELTMSPSGVCVVVPHAPAASEAELNATLRRLLDELFQECAIHDAVLWYYTPMALPFTRHLEALAVVYDCMDELSAFRGAPAAMQRNEVELMSRADVVFTGGISLFEAKSTLHPNVHPFPSSIDLDHFARARSIRREPSDQAGIPRPRLGFAGVIDERMDLDLIQGLARARPDWQIVLLGPVVKIDPASVPHEANIHALGARPYAELPVYMSGWDVGLLPFAHNPSTRFISPTKTPEYLAAGLRVVSTSIQDVVRVYGNGGLVQIADTVAQFVEAIDQALESSRTDAGEWTSRVDAFLCQSSWDRTWEHMMQLLDAAIEARSSHDEGDARTRLTLSAESWPSLPVRNAAGCAESEMA